MDPGNEDTRGWYDPDSATDRVLASLAGFNPASPRQVPWGRYLEHKLLLIDAAQRVDAEDLDGPLFEANRKRRDMEDFIRSGQHLWADVEAILGIPWAHQVRLLFNGHWSPLYGWDTDTQLDFEQDARAGMSIRRLADRYDLHYHQARKLVRLFRNIT